MTNPVELFNALPDGLVAAAETLCRDVLGRLPVPLAARLLRDARLTVAFSTNPLAGAVLAEAPAGETIQVGAVQGLSLPPATDQAVADFLEAQLERLPADAQHDVATALRGGARLAVLVSPFPPTVELVLFLSLDEAITIRRLLPPRETLH